MDTTEPVNLAKSIFLCNIFNFFFAATKICLIPFLTLYLRLLGLSATQTGIIIGSKTLSSFLFAPLWASCAMRCRKRRVVLLFAIFMMAVTYLSLTLVPAVNNSTNTCRSQLIANKTLGQSIQHTSTASPLYPSTTMKNKGEEANSSVTSKFTSAPINTVTEAPVDEEKLLRTAKSVLKKIGVSQEAVDKMDKNSVLNALRPVMEKTDNREILKQVVTQEQWNDLQRLFDKSKQRQKRDINILDTWEKFKQNVLHLKRKVKETAEKMTFPFVLLILVIGELFCSPVEKIADDSWFEFLEKIDDLEKYGKHRIWCSLASIILPVIVTLIVDNTDCLFGLSIHPFMLHFYLFGGFLGLTFLIGFYYPIPRSDKTKYKSKVIKAFGLTFCRCGGFLYVLTLLLMGTVFAAYNNYLFWVIQDLHGPESTMGMCITIAAFAEIPMLYFSKILVNKIGNSGVVVVALLCLSLRTLYYSYLWTPWAVLPAEITHAFTHTAMWYAVLSNPEFSVNPAVDRSIRSILSSIYFGIGFAAGSFASGFIYDIHGAPLLFRGCAIIAVVWFPFYFLLQKCCYKPVETEIKYSRLLQADDFQSDEEDDWLEDALKNR